MRNCLFLMSLYSLFSFSSPRSGAAGSQIILILRLYSMVRYVQTFSSPCSRSAIISATSSIPTEILTSPSVMPACLRTSGPMLA